MTVSANLSGNGRLSVPGGFPLDLLQSMDTMLDFIVPKGAETVTAAVYATRGLTPEGDGTDAAELEENAPTSAVVHMALFYAPTTSGGADGAIATTSPTETTLAEVSATVTANEQEIVLAVPASVSNGGVVAPQPLVGKLWVTGLVGTNGVAVAEVTIA